MAKRPQQHVPAPPLQRCSSHLYCQKLARHKDERFCLVPCIFLILDTAGLGGAAAAAAADGDKLRGLHVLTLAFLLLHTGVFCQCNG